MSDGCTDPDNCQRCRTMPQHRGEMRHAGIPTETNMSELERLESWATDIETHIAQGHQRGWALDYIAAREAEATLLREAAAALSRAEAERDEAERWKQMAGERLQELGDWFDRAGVPFNTDWQAFIANARAHFSRAEAQRDALGEQCGIWERSYELVLAGQNGALEQRDALAKVLLEISLTSKGYPNGSREGQAAISALADAEGKTPEQYLRDREALAAAADIQDDKGK